MPDAEVRHWTYCAGCNAPIMPKDGRWIIAAGLYPADCFATADGLHAPSLPKPKPKPVTLPRAVYDRLMHLAYAGANLLAEPNGQTDVEPYPVNKAWLDQIDKEAGNE